MLEHRMDGEENDMGVINTCDICGQPLRSSFTDASGKLWDDVSFQQKRYRRKVCFMHDSWTEYLSICGHCRYELAKRKIADEVE